MKLNKLIIIQTHNNNKLNHPLNDFKFTIVNGINITITITRTVHIITSLLESLTHVPYS